MPLVKNINRLIIFFWITIIIKIYKNFKFLWSLKIFKDVLISYSYYKSHEFKYTIFYNILRIILKKKKKNVNSYIHVDASMRRKLWGLWTPINYPKSLNSNEK